MKVLNYNPYDFNSVSLRGLPNSPQNKEEVTPQMSEVINNPTSNFVGRFLGIQDNSDWAMYYDKVNSITRWARQKANSNELPKIIEVITAKLNTSPSLNDRRINDLHIQIELEKLKGSDPDKQENGKVGN